jgi:uncharacterized protein YneF (UPF0154 family)
VWKLLIYKAITTIASLVVLGLCFGIILGVSLLQIEVKRSSHSNIGIVLLGIVASLMITVINGLLTFIMRKFAAMELPNTQTELNISIAKKLGMVLFITQC